MRKINIIFIHMSESSKNTTIDEIRSWHISKGWKDIGYHMHIRGDGKSAQGRKDSIIGAGVYGKNKSSLHICLSGDFNKEIPNEVQIDKLTEWLTNKCKQYNISVENILGHSDINKLVGLNSKYRTKKTCPGKNLYKLIPQLREKVKQNLKPIKENVEKKSCDKKCIDCNCKIEKKLNFLEIILEIINKLFNKG